MMAGQVRVEAVSALRANAKVGAEAREMFFTVGCEVGGGLVLM
jgi:hypothetical protein